MKMFPSINASIVSVLLFLSLAVFATPVDHVKREYKNIRGALVKCAAEGKHSMNMKHAIVRSEATMLLRGSFRSHCEKEWASATIPKGETIEYKAYYAGQDSDWAILTITAPPDQPIENLDFGCQFGFNEMLNACSDTGRLDFGAACYKGMGNNIYTKNASFCIWPQERQR